MKRIFVALMAAIVVTSCGTSANIESSWRDSGTSINMSDLNKVLVVALLNNEVNRRAVESQLAGKMNGKVIASFEYLEQHPDIEDEAKLQDQLKKDGFDGAIMMRIADEERVGTYVQGNYPAYYSRFGPYWSASWGAYQSGHFEPSKKVTVETIVYSLRKDKMIWSSLTSAVDPENTEKLMKAVGKQVYTRMKKDGFITTQ